MPRDEEWLTPKEVAARLGCNPQTIRRWHHLGIIESTQAREGGTIAIRWPIRLPRPRGRLTPVDAC